MRGLRAAMMGVLAMASVAAVASEASAQEVLRSAEDFEELCAVSRAETPEAWEGSPTEYHDHRRRAVHNIYETSLRLEGETLLEYDRVSGLMQISGFRRHQPLASGVEIRFRNECILSFEMSEEEAQNMIDQVALGGVELEIQFMPAAYDDYEASYCEESEGGKRELVVELLLGRLVDRSEETSEILGEYRTAVGHQWSLLQAGLGGTNAMGVPEVQVSHFQWRPVGQGWADEFGDEGPPEELINLQGRLQAEIERALYPCYVRALVANGSLQGALVLEVPFGQGERRAARFLMDTLSHQGFRECAEHRLEGVVESGEEIEAAQEVDAFKATLLLRRR